MTVYLSISALFWLLLGAVTAAEMHNPQHPPFLRYATPVLCTGMLLWSAALATEHLIAAAHA